MQALSASFRFAEGTQLFSFVAGRWDFEPFESARTELVFIGKKIGATKKQLIETLNKCTQEPR